MNDFILWLIIHIFGYMPNGQLDPHVLYYFYLWVYGIVPAFTGDWTTLILYWTGN